MKATLIHPLSFEKPHLNWANDVPGDQPESSVQEGRALRGSLLLFGVVVSIELPEPHFAARFPGGLYKFKAVPRCIRRFRERMVDMKLNGKIA